ncbi:MAG: hypothetical protein LBM66_01150 [Bifidobacteriaceae bacterium]|jgi:hypothetical protein|nr:hypothetical protein [Bifidobacteriaceae bacterium]
MKSRLLACCRFGTAAAAILTLAACGSAGQHQSLGTVEATATGTAASRGAQWVPTSGASGSGAVATGAYATVTQRFGAPPLAAYNGTDAVNATEQQAEDMLVKQCMRKRGYDYAGAGQDSGGAGGATDWEDFLGVTDLTQASKYGYSESSSIGEFASLTASPHPGVSLDAAGDLSITMPSSTADPARLKALYGDLDGAQMAGQTPAKGANDDNGCLTLADNQIEPKKGPSDPSIQAESFKKASAQAETETDVVAAKQKYLACMKQAGYDISQIPPIQGGNEPTPAQIKEATTDVGCKESTGLTATYVKALYAAEKQQIQQHAADFQSLENYEKASLQMATKALGQSANGTPAQ